MAAQNKRCLVKDCQAWEFMNGFCRQHVKQIEVDPAAKEQAKLTEMYRSTPAIKEHLVVSQQSNHPSHLKLGEGDYVDVVAVCSDNITYVCRTASGLIGYYDGRGLLTEEDVYALFIQEEAERAKQMEIERLAQAKLEEQRFEEKLRETMKLKAEEDRLRREAEAEQKRLYYEEQLRLYEAQQSREKQERQRQAEELQRRKQEMAARQAEENRLKAIEAHAIREVEEQQTEEMRRQRAREQHEWELEQARRKEAAYLQTLPPWKRDLVVRKKSEAAIRPPAPAPTKPVMKFLQSPAAP